MFVVYENDLECMGTQILANLTFNELIGIMDILTLDNQYNHNTTFIAFEDNVLKLCMDFIVKKIEIVKYLTHS